MDALGERVRFWRRRKGYSQLALSDVLGTSTRHLSFIETGRGHPSRGLLLRIAAALDVPQRARNGLLEAAGYAPQFGDSGLSPPEMAQVQTILDYVVEAALPYPAMVLDRYWNVVLSNVAFRHILATFTARPDRFLSGPVNLMEVTLAEEGLRSRIVNEDAFLPYTIGRLRRSFEREQDSARFDALRDIVRREQRRYPPDRSEGVSTPQILMPIHLRADGQEISLCTTMATIGMPQDATLQELFIEWAFPMDEPTNAFFQNAQTKRKQITTQKA